MSSVFLASSYPPIEGHSWFTFFCETSQCNLSFLVKHPCLYFPQSSLMSLQDALCAFIILIRHGSVAPWEEVVGWVVTILTTLFIQGTWVLLGNFVFEFIRKVRIKMHYFCIFLFLTNIVVCHVQAIFVSCRTLRKHKPPVIC